jgi:ribosomal protein L30E
MSIKEISEAIKKGNVLFGIKEALKLSKKSKKAKHKVFAVNDARDETIKKLEENKIDFLRIKNKEDTAKELNLDFECEIFSIK